MPGAGEARQPSPDRFDDECSADFSADSPRGAPDEDIYAQAEAVRLKSECPFSPSPSGSEGDDDEGGEEAEEDADGSSDEDSSESGSAAGAVEKARGLEKKRGRTARPVVPKPAAPRRSKVKKIKEEAKRSGAHGRKRQRSASKSHRRKRRKVGEAAVPPELLQFYRVEIGAIYRRHNPSKVRDVEQLLVKYQAKLPQLHEAICRKYGVPAARPPHALGPPPALGLPPPPMFHPPFPGPPPPPRGGARPPGPPGARPPGAPVRPPIIPMLHSVLVGVVKLVTPKGAMMRLSDGSHANYFDGLLRQRKERAEFKVGSRVYVKVVRIEMGMVVVDHRHVDQKDGQDKDPQNDLAEVEDWIDVPLPCVGRIIGQRGTRIRQICEESGADLRFDTGASGKGGGKGAAQGQQVAAGGGVGADLRKFLEETRTEEAAPVPESGPGDGSDLLRFLAEAKAGTEEAAREEEADEPSEDSAGEERALEFVAVDLSSWEEQLERRMAKAGVSHIFFENLTLTDGKGRSVDLSKGPLKPHNFPLKVRYVLPEAESKAEATAGALAELDREAVPRPEAVVIGGAERLTRGEVLKVLEAKDLPAFVDFEHISKTEVLCIFTSSDDAGTVLVEASKGFDDCPEAEEEEGPAMWRARRGFLTFRRATTADSKEAARQKLASRDAGPARGGRQEAACARLRINGDAVEVAKAKAAVWGFLEEFKGKRDFVAQGQISERLSVPGPQVGRLIGKGGETIKRLEQESGAKLKVLPLDPDAKDDDAEQVLLVVGPKDAVAKALDLVRPLIGQFRDRSPERSGVPQRQRAAASEADPNAPEAEARRPGALAARLGLPSLDGNEEAAVRPTPGDAAAAAAAVARSAEAADARKKRRMRERKRDLELREYEVQLMRQQQLEEMVREAEAEMSDALAFLAGPGAAADAAASAPGWEEDTVARPLLGRMALTSCGLGRLSRVALRHWGDPEQPQQRYFTFALLGGSTIQVPESTGLSWLVAVERWLGALVMPPKPAEDEKVDRPKAKRLLRGGLCAFEYLPEPEGFVISEAIARERGLAFRLASLPGDAPRAKLLNAAELQGGGWTLAESRVYLVELSTTPAALGHVAPYRHDYRKAREAYKQGDVVILEGVRPGSQDVGVVRRVLLGVKADKVAAVVGGIGHLRRVLWRSSHLERARREEQAVLLEQTVLPILSARLPEGAEALGIGASLDGLYLRLFVRLASLAAGAEGPAPSGDLKERSVAAAAAIGALLGCDTELLASVGGPSVEAKQEPAAVEAQAPVGGAKDDSIAEKRAKIQRKLAKIAEQKKLLEKMKGKKKTKKKKAKKGKSSSSSSSSSDSSDSS